MKHTFLTFTLSFFSFINVFAYDFTAICETGQELAYIINEEKKTVCVFKNSNVSGELIIPANVEYDSKIYRVTSIGGSAFSDCSGLTSITIPKSVTSIGGSAFRGCSGLTSIIVEEGNTTYDSRNNCNAVIYTESNVLVVGCKNTIIPESVTSIGGSAFSDCSGLTSITIPKSVTSIGSAFRGCSGLTSIIVEEGNTTYDSRNNCNAVIYTESNALVVGCKNTIIPESVTSIGQYAFYNCSGLTSIIIPESVISIGNAAFCNCNGLTSITIPKSVTSIESNAFQGCSALTSVNIPESVTIIDFGTFYCSGLTSIIIPESVKTILGGAFQNCSSLTSITIPKSVTSIESNAFEGCSALTSVTIPKSVTSIGRGAFGSCSALTSIIVEEGNTTYDSRNNCNAVINTESNALVVGCKNTIIPESVTSIDQYAFYDCSGLTSITIPESVTMIDQYAFYGCSGLTSITIPESVTSIHFRSRGDFFGCGDLTSIIVKEGNTKYDSRNNCNAVIKTESNTLVVGCKNTIIPETVTSIGGFAFYGCSGLTSITIPESVTLIGNNAFDDCSDLKKIICLSSTPPTILAGQFDCDNIYLYVPCKSKGKYILDAAWGKFKHIECIDSETVELTKDEVVVEPDKTEALFSMPKNEDANSYTLTIQNNGVTFCTLTFNAQGQLANIDFSTTKSYELKSGVEAFQFTVTGLSAATKYGYSFKALSSNKAVLKEYAGTFTTKNEDGTDGSGQGSQGGSTAVSEVSNATAVTIVNGQILVNGEAPAFVVTVSGQKIANANLKAGVYFVVVDGETVKVVVN